MKIKLYTIIALVVVIFALSVNLLVQPKDAIAPVVTDFDSCVAAGFPILESYPEQCIDDAGRSYTNQRQTSQESEAATGPDMSEDDARAAALNSMECIQAGTLGVFQGYNPLDDTWEYRIEETGAECLVCIVDDTTGSAGVAVCGA